MHHFYVMSNNWSPKKIATINDNQIEMERDSIPLVYKLNKNIVTYLNDEKNQNIGSEINFKIFEVADIKSYYYKKVAYRRCTAFLFLQVSDLGIRHMCYFSDKVVHSSASFGTSMEHVKKEDIFKFIIDDFTNNQNTINVLKFVFNINYNQSSLEDSLQRKFGI